ncbi:hypothetical protein ABT158_48565 [Nonomuraea sp. NPDC001636]|uniref:hypothetical protein n=1 Tax=Nonomuraea sp. NPDC001636 TaxID=3154391 RepID=UPI0033232BA9
MINPQEVVSLAESATRAVNRVLVAAKHAPVDVRFPIRDGRPDTVADTRALNITGTAVYQMQDGYRRNMAVSAWCLYLEVLKQVAREDMANAYLMHVHALALLEHANVLEAHNLVNAVSHAAQQGLTAATHQPPARGAHHRR